MIFLSDIKSFCKKFSFLLKGFVKSFAYAIMSSDSAVQDEYSKSSSPDYLDIFQIPKMDLGNSAVLLVQVVAS